MKPPFAGIRDIAVIVKVTQGIRPQRPTKEECNRQFLPDKLWAVMETCWHADPQSRPSAYKIFETLNNPFQRDIFNIKRLWRDYMQLQMMDEVTLLEDPLSKLLARSDL
jgi:hypothetical protein